MKLEEFFRLRGYEIKGVIEYRRKNREYLGWYKGFVESFHKYYTYNGERKVYKNRYNLNIVKKICESFADFLMNEKVKITLGDDKSTKILNDLLVKNNFWVKANQGIEKTFALGTGCFLLSLDEEKEIKLQFVNADNIYLLTYNNDNITECTFVSDKSVFNKESFQSEIIKDIQTHTLDSLGNYVIRNFRFVVGEGEDLREISVNDIPDEIHTGTNFRWFVPMK